MAALSDHSTPGSRDRQMGREWDSSTYHRLSDHQFEWGKKVLDRIGRRPAETVLDAGCGTGRLTAELLEHMPQTRVIAVDLSENMLRKAREGLATRFPGRIAFVCADLQQLPFHNCFDGIFSTATFHWAKDHPRLFASLCSALKPGGWLVAQCGGGPNLARIRHRAATLIASPKYAEYFGKWVEPWEFATPETTAMRLNHAGFVEVRTWTEGAGFSLPDERTFKEYLATVTLHRHLEQIPDPGLREQFLSDMMVRSDDRPDFSMDYWRLNLDATKPTTP